MAKKRVLAIIPAKRDSSRLPGKNLASLLGKPLCSYTMEQALSSKRIDRLVTITDDDKIAEISKRYGIEVPFKEPEELTKGKMSTIDAVLYTLDWFEKRNIFFDIVVHLEITSPLRKPDDIDGAIELFLKNFDNADSLVSVGEVQLENPYITRAIEGGFVKPFIREKGLNIYHSQSLPKAYFPYGVIYLSKVRAFKKYKSFYQPRTIPYFIERGQNYEINDRYDFLCVEAILKKRIEERRSKGK